MNKTYNSSNLLDLIGHTPLLFLESMSSDKVNLFAKLEGWNPGGSMKDRSASYIIKQAEDKGLLKPGGRIIESSSGNFGIALAMIGAAKGYTVKCVVDPRTTINNLKIMEAYGAEIEMVNTPHPEGGFQLARINKVKELLLEYPNAYWPNQYENEDNPTAYYNGVAKEVYDDMDGLVDIFVSPVSTCGLITGCAKYLKEKNSDIKVIAVDAAGSTIFGGVPKNRKMTGIGGNIRPKILKEDLIDHVMHVEDHQGFEGCRKLVEKEALLVGASSGAVIHATLEYLKNLKVEKPTPLNVVMVFPDNGDRYLNGFLKDMTLEEDVPTKKLQMTLS
ncbi:2,3-diaminopropionate biosynthesis protein SbnA [Priestia koreensis]|uniref:2,3-diaminopropionate biosynthesis protein SbnA n=1 Tax=Priestia koreensis TaxID=284581 RepID=UPI003D03FB34